MMTRSCNFLKNFVHLEELEVLFIEFDLVALDIHDVPVFLVEEVALLVDIVVA